MKSHESGQATEHSPLSRWKNDDSDVLDLIESIEKQHGHIPRDVSDELSRLLEIKLDRLNKIRGKLESTARKDAEEQFEKWREEEGNLIMILHAIQNKHGYVPREVAMELSRLTDVKLARIYEVITFYHYFKLVPPGKHNVSICMGTACYLKGAPQIAQEVKNLLKIQEGQTTPDREFHLDTVRCIGCCGMAPAMTIDGKTCGKVKSTDVAGLLAETKKTEASK